MHGGEYKSKTIHMIRKEGANFHGINSCQTGAVAVAEGKKARSTFHHLAHLFVSDIVHWLTPLFTLLSSLTHITTSH